MTVTSVRLDDATYQSVKMLADAGGVSISTMIRRIIDDRLEDEADYRDATRIMQTGDKNPVDPSDLRAELGLPEPSHV